MLLAPAERFARGIFTVAGIYGLLVLTPGYFMEEKIAIISPPAITHPELYYGFIGLALTWQLVFLRIARNPGHYRVLMPLAILEKLAFGIPALVLYAQGRLVFDGFAFALIDWSLGILFAIAYWRTVALGSRP